MRCSSMEKINYNERFKEFIKTLGDKKPSLLLHACCGPCLTYPLSVLVKYFNVTVLYVNPNIYPKEEYELRYKEVKRFVEEYSKDEGIKIDLVKEDVPYEEYLDVVKGHEGDLEGGHRCLLCHRYRMDLAYSYASKNNFEYFTTVMTVSSKKPSQILNEIGIELSKKYVNTKFLEADFKKENCQLIGINIAKKYNLYRQCYCGCEFSYRSK